MSNTTIMIVTASLLFILIILFIRFKYEQGAVVYSKWYIKEPIEQVSSAYVIVKNNSIKKLYLESADGYVYDLEVTDYKKFKRKEDMK